MSTVQRERAFVLTFLLSDDGFRFIKAELLFICVKDAPLFLGSLDGDLVQKGP
jgi:hypothetical protein